MNTKGQAELMIGLFVVLGIVLFLCFMFRVVSYDQYCFEKEFGKLYSDLKVQGIRYIGIGSLMCVNNQVRNHELLVEATSIDLQDVAISLNINMKLKDDNAFEFVKNYQSEDVYKQYLDNKIQERVKISVLKYKAEDFIYNRSMISEEIYGTVKNIPELEYFDILDISVKNVAYSPEFTAMLERKAQVDIERQIIVKQNENVVLTKKNIDLITDMDAYFKYMIAQKWDGSAPLTMVN